jgi:hypothetical protein
MCEWLIVGLNLLFCGRIIHIIKRCGRSYFGLVQGFATVIIIAINQLLAFANESKMILAPGDMFGGFLRVRKQKVIDDYYLV